MKIRTSFISNSSSSSYILITSKENHDKALAKLTTAEMDELNECFSFERKFGIDLVTIGKLNIMDSATYIGGKEHTYPLYNAFIKYKHEVRKNPDEVLEYSEEL